MSYADRPSSVTYKFDPPILLPPGGDAHITGGLEFCTVTVRDHWGRQVAFGRYQRTGDLREYKYKLISGTTYTPPTSPAK